MARRAWCAVRFLPIPAEAFAAADGLLGYELPGYVAHGHGHGRGGAEHEHGVRGAGQERKTKQRRQLRGGGVRTDGTVTNYYYEGGEDRHRCGTAEVKESERTGGEGAGKRHLTVRARQGTDPYDFHTRIWKPSGDESDIIAPAHIRARAPQPVAIGHGL